ncbi:MAG: hypothetical protein WA790_19925 [Sulfitobacter sp.]
MDIEGFLAKADFTLADLHTHLQTSLEPQSGEVVFVCGSLVEGLGNTASDIDVVLITSRERAGVSETGNIVTTLGSIICDTFIMTPDALHGLLDRLNILGTSEADLYQSAKGFTDYERRLIHRLFTAMPVFGEADLRMFQRRVTLDAIQWQKYNRSRHEALALQLDLRGLVEQKDWNSVVFCAQNMLDWSIDALLTGFGATNPVVKWRISQLQALPPDWFCNVPGLYGPENAAQYYLSMRQGITDGDPQKSYAYAQRILTLSRQIFLWVEHRLRGGAFCESCKTLVPDTDLGSADTLAQFGPQIAFRSHGDHVEVFELNNSENRYSFPAYAANILPHFGSALSVDQVIGLFSDDPDMPDAKAKVMGLREFVTQRGWEAQPMIDESQLSAVLKAGSA